MFNKLRCYITGLRILKYLRSNYPGIYTLSQDVIHFQTSLKSELSPYIYIAAASDCGYRFDLNIDFRHPGHPPSRLYSRSFFPSKKAWRSPIDTTWEIFVRSHLDSDLQYHMFLQSKKHSQHVAQPN